MNEKEASFGKYCGNLGEYLSTILMNQIIYPSAVKGSIPAPPSKSMTQRAIAAGLLAEGTTVIRNPAHCNDSEASIGIATNLGAIVSDSQDEIRITGSGMVSSHAINCGESGLAMRMFAPIAALQPGFFTFTGEGSLLKRPVTIIEDALVQVGVSFRSTSGLPPFELQGPLKGGKVMIDGSLSSQLLTGLLMALPLAPKDSLIKVKNLKSKPYIAMTLELLNDFGIHIENSDFEEFIVPGSQTYKAREYIVEGDWSNAAFLLVAGAIKGSIELTGLNLDSKQADIAILEALQKAGAIIVLKDDSIQVHSATLKAFQFDASESPDLFPPLAVLAAYCDGTSVLVGSNRLIHKESNRAQSIVLELGNAGIRVEIRGDDMHIQGGKIQGTTLHSHNDHRIAMMGAIAAIGADGPVTITGAKCVDKSFPGFFECLQKIGIKTIQ